MNGTNIDWVKKNTSAIIIDNLTNAEMFLNLLEDKKIPIIGACTCIDTDVIYSLNPICGNEHIILVLDRHYEIALELLRSIEENFPILY